MERVSHLVAVPGVVGDRTGPLIQDVDLPRDADAETHGRGVLAVDADRRQVEAESPVDRPEEPVEVHAREVAVHRLVDDVAEDVFFKTSHRAP